MFGAAVFLSTLASAALHRRFSNRTIWRVSQIAVAVGFPVAGHIPPHPLDRRRQALRRRHLHGHHYHGAPRGAPHRGLYRRRAPRRGDDSGVCGGTGGRAGLCGRAVRRDNEFRFVQRVADGAATDITASNATSSVSTMPLIVTLPAGVSRRRQVVWQPVGPSVADGRCTRLLHEDGSLPPHTASKRPQFEKICIRFDDRSFIFCFGKWELYCFLYLFQCSMKHTPHMLRL